jgi:hypothetical protein
VSPGISFGNRVFPIGINEGSGDKLILDQLWHPRHWARPPYWNMVKSHRTEGNGVFSERCVTWDLSMGPHLEIGPLQTDLREVRFVGILDYQVEFIKVKRKR